MIELKNLEMKVPGFALKDINLQVNQGEYFILLGPTGAGKTLLLETISGIYPQAAGEIVIRGQTVTGQPPEKRGVGIVYQDQALFPHLSVRNNILFGLKVKKTDSREQGNILNWLCGLLDIENLLERRPINLSGGERQKVALARALAVRPDLLLLDEPLSALDPESHEKLEEELRQIHNRLGITTLHVTHNFEEAMSLGQRIAILNKGRIYQTGTPEDIFLKPASAFVARYTMSRNIFKGRVVAPQNRHVVFETDAGWKMVTQCGESGANYACIRPESISVSLNQPVNAVNSFRGTVISIANLVPFNLIRVSLPHDIFCFSFRRDSNNIKAGSRVWVHYEPEAVHLFKDAAIEDAGL